MDITFQLTLRPTNILSYNFVNGKIYQLWVNDNNLFEKNEWRPLPELEDAKKKYGGMIVS